MMSLLPQPSIPVDVDHHTLMAAAADRVLSAAQPADVADADRVYSLDPLRDPRWSRLVDRHPAASVFHSVSWLLALRNTYGYKPVVFTRSAPSEELRGGMVFCEVDSWLTGRRMVSLPFSDHCEPLLASGRNSGAVLSALEQQLIGSGCRYIEVRPLVNKACADAARWQISAKYCFHQLDLRPPLGALFHNFHKDSIQRKIRRAERERLAYHEGSNEATLDVFYRLLVATRKRHQIPPQPRSWFANLMAGFGDALKIRLAFKADRPIAGMITIRHKDTLYYKYGGSNAAFHNLGAMHLLYWNAIQDAKTQGLSTLDLGRSDAGQSGLITFKSRWGAASSSLNYYRFASAGKPMHAFDAAGGMKKRVINGFCSIAPEFLLSALGDVLYKHIG